MNRPRVVVVGGGVSGLAAAWRLSLLRPDAHVTVMEAAARFGGKLVSEHRDGFVVEGAADGFLARKPPALEWARELGLEPDLIEPRPEQRFSHVWWEGALHPMPEGFTGLVPGDPAALLRTSLLTPEGAARAAAEREVPLGGGGEESVEQFFTRRYGEEAFERLFEPLLAGIWAGDASRLSAEAAFPQLVAIERGGQTLTDGLAGPRPSGPAFRSFRGGMAALPAALVHALSGKGLSLLAGTTVRAVRGEGPFIVDAGSSFAADAVIVALPPRAAGALMPSPAAGLLREWPTSSVVNLNLAFAAGELEGLPEGSGFVAPRAGGTPFTAATWSHQKWPHRAPEGSALVRVYFGGARDPQAWSRPEAELVEQGLSLLEHLLGRRPPPLWHRVFRWKDAFAPFDLGHAERLRTLDAALPPGLVLCGGYFTGVGVPDCLAQAGRAAEAVDRFLRKRESTA